MRSDLTPHTDLGAYQLPASCWTAILRYSGRLHRSLNAESRYNFINIALWEDEDLCWKAYEQSAAPMKGKLDQLGVEMTPALYTVAFEY